MARFFVIALCLAFAHSAQAKVIWRGDFESGDISQWTKAQWMGGDRLKVVSDPVVEGRHALKVTVKQGDDPIGASGNRNELVYTADRPAEEERVYRWHTLWPSTYESPDTWQLFTQWHHDGNGGSPPVEFFARGEKIFLRVDGKDVWTAPLERARWHEFVFHIRWSADAKKGFVSLYYDGELVLPRTPARTLFPGQSVYLKQGLYRHASVAQPQTIFHDGMTIATALEDVLGPPPAAPAEPAAPAPDASNTQQPVSPEDVGEGPRIEMPNGEVVTVGATGCQASTVETLWPALWLVGLWAVLRRVPLPARVRRR